MNVHSRAFLARVKAGISIGRDLSHLAQWLEENTRHPKDRSKPWSFAGHEYQIDILSDASNDLVAKKPAQVGFSEISVRAALGIIDIFQHSTAIYTLPTASDASLFAKSRFDPVIEASEELKAKVHKDTDNTSVKKIGDSFLFIRGTFTQRAAISIPADILIHDEVDFSDHDTLTSFTSRLGHVREEDIIKRRFSTPTVSGYGVSGLFADSKQYWRAVKCDSCFTWQIPVFLQDVIIPGYDNDIMKLEKEDLDDGRYDFDKSYVSCPSCHAPLTVANLADPSKREWVAKYPDMQRAGYQVQSFDLPQINTIRRTLRSIRDYKRKSDWVNFAIGQEYEDADTSFVKAAVERGQRLAWIEPHANAATGTVVGIDVGKTSWIVVGKQVSARQFNVLHHERVKTLEGDDLVRRAVEIFSWYGAEMLVIDAAPEWSQAKKVVSALPAGKAFACYYGSAQKPTMSHILDTDEEAGVVKVDRTSLISDTAKEMNAGNILMCRCPESPTMLAHLDVVKKIRRPNAKGIDQEVWVNSGDRPDHYAHALFFARAANYLLNYQFKESVVPALPLPAKVRIGGTSQENERPRSFLDRR